MRYVLTCSTCWLELVLATAIPGGGAPQSLAEPRWLEGPALCGEWLSWFMSLTVARATGESWNPSSYSVERLHALKLNVLGL